MNTLASELQSLQGPTAPAGMSATIASRIARMDEQRQTTASSVREDVGAASRRGRLAWPLLLLGLSLGVGAQVYQLAAGETPLDLIDLRIAGGLQSVLDLAQPSPAMAVLGAGVLLALAGMLALQRDVPQHL